VVSSSGLVSGMKLGGPVTITASTGSGSFTLRGSAAVTVTAVPVAAVTVTPSTASLAVGGTQQYTATPKDTAGNTLTARTVAWTTSAAAVATVSATGLVTAVALGSATVTATVEGIVGTAAVTVTAVPVATVTVSPSTASLAVGGTQQYTATPKDAAGNTLAGRTVAWTTSAAAVATVSATGLVTAVAPGNAAIMATVEGVAGTAAVTVSLLSGPLHVSARNHRYFEDAAGHVVPLIGSHTWNSLQDVGYTDPPPVLNYSGYLDFLQARGHNFFRLWAWEHAKWHENIPTDFWFAPSAYQRTGPDTALDGKPKFDLTKLNDAYFIRLRERGQEAAARGIYVSVMLFQGFSVGKHTGAPQNPWRGHPMNPANNVNGINGDPNNDGSGSETHTLAIPAVTAIQEAYVRRVIDAVNDLDNVLYEICNESDPDGVAWQYHMIDVVRQYEASKPKQHPVGMTSIYPNGVNADLFASPADWISPNGTLENPPLVTGAKVVINDTDHLCGLCASVNWVWESAMRGANLALMDPYYYPESGINPNDPTWVLTRANMGYARALLGRFDTGALVPSTTLASSGYCLSNAAATAPVYLVYLPSGGSVTVDLTASPGTRTVEWLNPATGVTTTGGSANGGAIRSFSAPFGGSAVLIVY
jgi:hypothetical protein